MRFLIALIAVTGLLSAQPTPETTSRRFFDRPGALAAALKRIRLSPDLSVSFTSLEKRLASDGFRAVAPEAGAALRVGAKRIALPSVTWWKRVEQPGTRAWLEVIELADDKAAAAIPPQWRQPHTGVTDLDAFTYITLNAGDGLDAIGAISVRGRHIVNLGIPLPMKIRLWENPSNSPEELSAIDRASDQLAGMLDAAIAVLKDPEYITWVPRTVPDEDEILMRRVASFARLWSEAKYNFVFLNERRNVDWDHVLELYLPRVLAAKSNDEYVTAMKEAIALLADGHTSVQGGRATDQPPVRIQPVEGRPVLTGIADLPELKSSGLRRGMELVSVDGVPADELRSRNAKVVAASTPQSRQQGIDWMLLQGAPNTRASAVFRTLDGTTVPVELTRNQSSVSWQLLPWRQPPFEYLELPGNIAYVALNSFGSADVVRRFDEHFSWILKSRALIIDVRENGGGSSNHGYSIISRLIGKGVKLQTTAWRTRDYKPVFRAWGRSEEWHEGTHDTIEARGETPFAGRVVVLIGPNTFSAAEDFLVPLKMSKRATLVGSPTGGSTGQPVFVPLYNASARICTKWDRFADGTEFVGVGVQPDVFVEPTRADVAAGRDPVLERAVALLSADQQQASR